MPRLPKTLFMTFLASLIVYGIAAALEPAAESPVVQPMPASHPADADVRAAIRTLNHPLPARRREAMRQLAAWGPLAFERLRETADGPDLEAALLAGDLLAELGEVVLIGGQVRLELDRPRIAWNEPLILTVHVDNPTAGPIRVPWPVVVASTQAGQDDARQVGAMMDVADFLTVTGPDGQEVELRVDPIERDSGVHRAIEIRAGDDPPSHQIAANGSDRLVVTRFNRGWARYPLLQAGTYAIQLRYQPQWQDESWTRQGFGLVASNRVEVEVVEAAPLPIRLAERPLKFMLSQKGSMLEGELVSTWDRDMWVNLNVGGPRETHARVEWQPSLLDQEGSEPFELEADASGPVFQADRLQRLAPGAKLTVVRSSTADVLHRARLNIEGEVKAVPMALRYTHLASPESLRAGLRVQRRHEGVPAELFSGSVTSETILIDAPTEK